MKPIKIIILYIVVHIITTLILVSTLPNMSGGADFKFLITSVEYLIFIGLPLCIFISLLLNKKWTQRNKVLTIGLVIIAFYLCSVALFPQLLLSNQKEGLPWEQYLPWL